MNWLIDQLINLRIICLKIKQINKITIKQVKERIYHLSLKTNNSTDLNPDIDYQKMKLNFSTLAKQIDNKQDQTNPKQNDPQQLNYYRKSTVEQSLKPSIMKQRKSQLNQDTSQLLLGSSILESYFSVRQPSTTQQDQQLKVNLSVMYPYQISKSLTPSNINQEIHSMRAKGILNDSAVKFVKKQIIKDLSKSKEKNKIQKLNRSVDKVHESVFLDPSLQADHQNYTDFLSMTHNSIKNTQHNSILETTVSSKLFKNFLKESTQKLPANNQQLNQQKKLSVAQLLTPSKKKKNLTSKHINQAINPHYMNSIHKKQKSIQTNKQLIPTSTMKFEQQLKQVKSKPSLQLTKSSPFTQKISQQRQSQYHSKKASVFDSLYNQAYKRQCMYQLQKQSKQKQIDEKINQKKGLQTNMAKKYKVQGSFLQRLQKSIERKYYKEYLTKKYQVNLKTGQPFFVPDTNLSKHTYEELFHRSLEKVNSEFNGSVILANTLKNKLSAKGKSKQQSQIALSTHFSHTIKSVKRTKQNSIQKLSQVDKLNRSMEIEGNNKNNKKLTDSRSLKIIEKRDQKIIDRIVGLFYPSQTYRTNSKQQKELGREQQLGFQKTYEAMYQMTEREYLIISPLFQQVQALQQSSKVTSLIFRNLFTQFYQKLNHYDQVILRQKIMKKNKQQGKLKIVQQKPKNFQMSVDSVSDQKSRNEQKYKHRPKINEISASMEKINPKYEAELYYV